MASPIITHLTLYNTQVYTTRLNLPPLLSALLKASMRTQSIPNCQRGLKSIMHLHICKSPVFLLNIKPRNLQKLGKLGTPLSVMLNQSREYILNNQFQRHKSYPLILCSTDSQILPDMWEQTFTTNEMVKCLALIGSYAIMISYAINSPKGKTEWKLIACLNMWKAQRKKNQFNSRNTEKKWSNRKEHLDQWANCL